VQVQVAVMCSFVEIFLYVINSKNLWHMFCGCPKWHYCPYLWIYSMFQKQVMSQGIVSTFYMRWTNL